MGLSHDGMKYTDTTGDFLAWCKVGAYEARIECHKAPPDEGMYTFCMSCHVEHADKAPLLRALAAAWGLSQPDLFPPAPESDEQVAARIAREHPHLSGESLFGAIVRAAGGTDEQAAGACKCNASGALTELGRAARSAFSSRRGSGEPGWYERAIVHSLAVMRAALAPVAPAPAPTPAPAKRCFRWAPGLVGRMTREAVEASKRQGSFGQAGAALGWLPWPDDYAVPSKSEAQLLSVFWLAYDAALQGQTAFPQPEQAVRTAVLAGLRAAKRRGLLPPETFERLPPR